MTGWCSEMYLPKLHQKENKILSWHFLTYTEHGKTKTVLHSRLKLYSISLFSFPTNILYCKKHPMFICKNFNCMKKKGMQKCYLFNSSLGKVTGNKDATDPTIWVTSFQSLCFHNTEEWKATATKSHHQQLMTNQRWRFKKRYGQNYINV